ncbi:CopD family protein [Ectothiorhodospiraceae bacterium 2226]|nr:CopD family protein [Ectothiorhodospiraceae bacterium 2226]
MSLAITLHVLAAILWVGGMFFAYMCLRPVAATLLEPAQRLPLWSQVFGRFFPWVWASVIALPATGFYMIFAVFGGMGNVGLYVHAMTGLGIVMIMIYLHVYFAPYRRLQRAVAAADWPAGGKALGQIRFLVGLNLILGLVTAAIATGGPYLY